MKENVKLKKCIIFIVIFMIMTVNAFDFQQLKVSTTSQITNIVSTYTINYNRAQTNSFSNTAFTTTPLQSTSTLTVTFPIQYTLTPSITCTYQLNSTGAYLNNNCAINGNQIVFSNIFADNTTLRTASVIISNVQNPFPSGKTSPFGGTIGNDISVVSGSGTNSVVYIAAATSSGKFIFVDNHVSSDENMVITLTIRNILPEAGTITVLFPSTRKWSKELNPTRQMPISTSMACRGQSSNINSVLQCAGTAVGSLVTIANIANATLSAGSTISFTIDNFISPPTNQPADNINITTYTGSNSIDTCNILVEGMIPKTIPSTQFFISETDYIPMIVNQQYTIKFDYTTLDYMSLEDTILIKFPSGVTIDNFGPSQVSGDFTIDIANSNFYNSQLNLKLDGTGSVNPGRYFITVSNFVAPPNILPTNNFELQILSNGYPRMNSFQSLTAVTGSITGSVSMTNTVVNSLTRYTFTVTTANVMTSAGKIKITFPEVLTLTVAANCAVLSGTSVTSIPTCTKNVAQNSIILTNLNTSTNSIPAQNMVLTISFIQNAPSTTKTSAFLVQTFYTESDSMMVDAGYIDGVTSTIGTIDNTKVVISSSSVITSATGVTYGVQFVTTHGIVAGGFVRMNLPLKVIFNLATATNNCNVNINGGSSISTPCLFTQTASYYVVNFTNPFPINSLNNNSTIKFSILNAATNHISTQPVSPFSIFTFSSDGKSIASTSSPLSYSVTTPSNLISNTLQRVSNKNAQITTYTITCAQIAPLEANSIILVQFPSSVLPQGGSTCTMIYLGSSTTVACGLTGNVFKFISFGTVIPARIQFSLSITNIRNPYSFAPLTGCQITTKTSLDTHFYSRGTTTNILTNTIPTAFSVISYIYAPQQLGQALSLSITFQLSQFTVIPQYLLISIDPYFIVGTLSCNSFIDFTGSCTNQINNTLKVTGAFNNSVMGLTITGFSTPNSAPSVVTYSTLGSFDSNNYKIDESTNNISFSLNCNMPCKSCSVSNKSSCSSCYSRTSITNFVFYHATSTNCYVNCPDTSYNNNATLLCAPCDSNCLNCNGVPTFCTKCKPSSVFPYLNISGSTQVCVTSCVSTMYPESSIDPPSCVACKSPCQTCTTQTLCLTCRSGFFYLGNNSCWTQCPQDYTIANNVTNICQFCVGICRTCSATVNNCTSCNSPLVFYNGSCQSSCPAGGSLAPYNGICTPCITQCLTCNLTISNCTSCNASSIYVYYVNNSCLVQCPIYFYNQSSTQSCISCATAGINCVNCSSASTCYTCDNSYVLFENRCLNYVPTGYVNISGVAVSCSGDCKTCSISATNCTQCKTLSLQNFLCVANCQSGTIPISQVCSSCLYPCLTCSIVLFNCTSCVTNATPSVYLSSNSCQQTCPDFTYRNNSNFQCSACINNCLLCTSANYCTSCNNITSLLNNTCLSECPAGMVGINRICQSCTNNCKTCVGAINICSLCVNGTYFLNSSSCVTNCGTGLYIDYPSQTCIGCTEPCKTCVNTTSTCLSCTTGYLINNLCQVQCPNAMYPLVGKCVACPNNCSACVSSTNCSSCSGDAVLHNNFCIQSCPQTHAYVVNNICLACSTQFCYSCTSSNVCLSCLSGKLILKGICLELCPTGYVSNGTHCNDILQAVLQSKNNSFPVPFTIAGVVMVIACLMSRLQFSQTYLSGAIYSLIGILQIAALLVFLGIYFMEYPDQPIPLFIGIASALFLYLLNVIALITQTLFLSSEKQFQDWNQARCNKIFYYFTNFFSLFICHKFRNILFCKLFTFKVFSAKLSKIQNFRIFNIFSLVSLMHSGGALFAAGIAVTKVDPQVQIYQQAVDVIVLTSLNIVMAFFNTHKQKDFFLEITPEGYSLHRKNNMIEEHLVGGTNFHDVGNDIQIEKGYINMHSHSLSSQQALQFDKNSQAQSYDEQYSDTSLAAISQKQYEEISVQAVDMIPQKMNVTAQTGKLDRTKNISYEEISIQADELLNNTQPHRGIDLSQLPPQGFQHDSSNFTSFEHPFKRVDKSIQGYPQRANYSIQMKPQQNDRSFQHDKPGNKVDCSVQKYSNYSKVDMSIQPSYKSHQDHSIQAARLNQSFGMQQKPSFSNKNIFIQADMQDAEIQMSQISQEESLKRQTPERGIYTEVRQYNEIAVQRTLDPSEHQMGIQYEQQQMQVQKQQPKQINFKQFQQQINHSNNETNVLCDQQIIEQQQQRQLAEQKAQELQLQNDNVRSHQEQLQERIRNKQRQLEDMRRKVELKMRLNEKRKESLARKNIEEQDYNLGPVQYIEQRPDINPPQRRNYPSSSQNSHTNQEESLYDKPSEIITIRKKQTKTEKSQKKNQAMNFRKHTERSHRQSQKLSSLHSKQQQDLHSKQHQGQEVAFKKKQTQRSININNNNNINPHKNNNNNNPNNDSYNESSNSHIQDNTIEEIKIVNDSKVQSQNKKQRQKTIEQIRLEDVKPQRPQGVADKSKSQKPIKNVNKKPIDYNEVDDELISQDSLGDEVSRQHQNHRFIPPRQFIEVQQEIRSQSMKKHNSPGQKFKFVDNQGQNLSEQINNSSMMTKKINPVKKSIVVDVGSIDRSFSGQQNEELVQLQQVSQSDRQPTGILNRYYHEKPNFRQSSPSQISGTIQEIPRNYSKVDHEKTIINKNNHLDKTQKLNNNPQPTKIENQQVTNYFAGSLPKSNNQRSKNQIPQDKQVQKFRINKLYSNNDIKNKKVEDKIPSNLHNRQKNSNTFAMAAQNQLNDQPMHRKPINNNYPLNTQQLQWQVRQEDRFISEDEEFSKKHVNRNNLVKRPNKDMTNFASHLVLPQQSDKQDTSFHQLAKKHEVQAPNTAKQREPKRRPEVQQIQVHFQSQQAQNEYTNKMHNESPGIPRAFQTNRLTSNGQNSLYEEQSQDLDYKKQILLQQMQKRPDNDDLQDYYQKKGLRNSKEKRGKSNTKMDKSTEKIYMQRLDRYRK